MPTVRDIARSIGVSPATVSRSLNRSTGVSKDLREQVLAEAKRSGYQFRPKKARPESDAVRPGMVGMLFFNASSGVPFSGYDGIVWGGVARAAIALKYGVAVVDPFDRKPGEGFAQLAERIGVEGFVVRVDDASRQRAVEIAEAGVPHVVIADRFDEDERVNYVSCNSYPASYAAFEHLIHLGHRRIGIGHNPVLDTDHLDRLRAYRKAHEDHGIEIDPQLIIPAATDERGGASAFNRLMALPEPPTAMFFTDPRMTATALRRSLEVGVRVPEELSIVGVDDESLRETTFPVYTSVCQKAEELGFTAGRWLCRQLAAAAENPAKPRELPALRDVVDAVLEVNQSTASVPSPAKN